MTPIEQAVWAATFAQTYREEVALAKQRGAHDPYRGHGVTAADLATGAVQDLRESRAEILDNGIEMP